MVDPDKKFEMVNLEALLPRAFLPGSLDIGES